MPRIFAVFILLFLQFYSLEAQKGFVSGYIVNLDQDTLRGLVKDRSMGTFPELYSKIRFKKPRGGLRKKYGPDEIRGYGYANRHFESVSLAQEMNFLRASYLVRPGAPKVFLKVIAKSENLSFYHREYVDGDNGHLDFLPLFYKSGDPEMVRVTQGLLGLKRKRLAEYFSDCPELVKGIQDKDIGEVWEVYDFYLQACSDK